MHPSRKRNYQKYYKYQRKTPSSELQKIIDEQEVQILDLSIHSANNLSELLEENEKLKNEVSFQTCKAERYNEALENTKAKMAKQTERLRKEEEKAMEYYSRMTEMNK
jgi:hypothetical protein